MAAKRAPALLAILAIALTACGGKAKIFTSTDLTSIILGQNDAPSGLQYVAQGSGPQSLEAFAGDEAGKTELTKDGFQGASQSIFANTSAITTLSGGKGGEDARIVAVIAVVLKDADGAHKALLFEHQDDLSKGSDITTISVTKIGDETIGEHGKQQDLPYDGYVISWRVGNAVFAVLVAGGSSANVTLDQAITLAKTMNERAQKA